MTNLITTASEQIDYPFLLLTHIVCADQQIHSEESKSLRELADIARIGQQTRDEMEKILAQDDDHFSVEDVASRVPSGQQNEAMRQILAIAYADGFFAPLEREMVERIARIWNWSTGEIDRIIQAAQDFTAKRSSSNVDEQLSLLSDPEYDEAIKQCAKIANEDYKYAEIALTKAESALRQLGQNLLQVIQEIQQKINGNDKATSVQETATPLKNSIDALNNVINK
jgi:uncharacterized tellurite resistance protein B-like protein